MHEDNGPVLWEHEIGATWKAAATQPVAQASPMQLLANTDLKCRVPLPNTAHLLRALLGGEGISHAFILRG